MVLEDLGAPPEQLFRSFNPNPIASASLAQVRGALLDVHVHSLKCTMPYLRYTLVWYVDLLASHCVSSCIIVSRRMSTPTVTCSQPLQPCSSIPN